MYIMHIAVKTATSQLEKSIIHIAVADDSILTYILLLVFYCSITIYTQTSQLKITNIYSLIICVA